MIPTLSGLTLGSGLALEPAFNPRVYDYVVHCSADTTEVGFTISIDPESGDVLGYKYPWEWLNEIGKYWTFDQEQNQLSSGGWSDASSTPPVELSKTVEFGSAATMVLQFGVSGSEAKSIYTVTVYKQAV